MKSTGKRLARTGVALGFAALALTGCIGRTSRSEFQGVIESRGGGATSDLTVDAFAQLRAELGVDDPELLRLAISPNDRRVTMDVRDPARPDFADTYRWTNGEIEEPDPLQVGADGVAEGSTFHISEVPALVQLEDLVDETFEALAIPGAYVVSITVNGMVSPLEISVEVDSERMRGSATFDADGNLVEAVRS